MQRWIAAYTALHPAVTIDLVAKGALTAAPALASGEADIAVLGRELTPSELNSVRNARHLEPTSVPVALGSYDLSGKTVALAFYVNSANPIQRLTFQQLDAIFCSSLLLHGAAPIARWGQLDLHGEWTDRPIHPIGVNFPDGISNFIRLRVCHAGEFRHDIHEEHTGGPINVLDRIVTDVAADPDAIGYAGFANVQPGARLVAISEDGGPFLTGTREEVAAARYPLTRYVYLMIAPAAGQSNLPLERDFLRFVLSPQGQALVGTDHVYMPLPPAAAAAQQESLR